jgi:hypothetical protein
MICLVSVRTVIALYVPETNRWAEKCNTKYFALKRKTLAIRPHEKQKLSEKNELIPSLEIGKPQSGRNLTLREDQNYTHCCSMEKLNMGNPEPLALLGNKIILLEKKAKSLL